MSKRTAAEHEAPSAPALHPSYDHVLLGAALADTKDAVYRNTLTLAALVDTLVAAGVVSREALATAAERLDREEPDSLAR